MTSVFRRYAWPLAWLTACGVGAVARLYQISDQIVADDEWHAIHGALYEGWVHILTHLGRADPCIPLSLLDKLAAETVGLSEAVMRAPVLACGLAAVALFPRWFRDWATPRAAVAFAWLLAVSPLHVYFSRYARPYAVSLFLAWLAVFALYRWWKGGDPRWRWAYAGSALAAVYFHLTAAPVALGPLGLAFVDGWLRRRTLDPARLRRLASLALGMAGGALVLLGPPLVLNAQVLLRKVGRDRPDWETARGAVELLFGSGHTWFALALATTAALGGALLWTRRPRLAAYLGGLTAAQLGFVIVAQPRLSQMPIVLARYLLPILPILLLGVALGAEAVDDALRRFWARSPRGVFTAAVCALACLLGPLPATYYRPNNWTNHALFQYAYSFNSHVRYDRLRPIGVPPFYRHLRETAPPGSLLIAEAPWCYEWHYNRYPHFQKIHRQRMVVGFVVTPEQVSALGELLPGQPGTAFRNFVHVADFPGLKERGVDYVVFHKDLGKALPRWRRRTFVDVAPALRLYRSVCGAPTYEDDAIVVFSAACLSMEAHG